MVVPPAAPWLLAVGQAAGKQAPAASRRREAGRVVPPVAPSAGPWQRAVPALEAASPAERLAPLAAPVRPWASVSLKLLLPWLPQSRPARARGLPTATLRSRQSDRPRRGRAGSLCPEAGQARPRLCVPPTLGARRAQAVAHRGPWSGVPPLLAAPGVPALPQWEPRHTRAALPAARQRPAAREAPSSRPERPRRRPVPPEAAVPCRVVLRHRAVLALP